MEPKQSLHRCCWMYREILHPVLSPTCAAGQTVHKLAIWILFLSCFVHTISSGAASDLRPANSTSPPPPASTSSPSPHHAATDQQVIPLDKINTSSNSTVFKFNIPAETSTAIETNTIHATPEQQTTINTVLLDTTSANPPPKPKPTRRKIFLRGHLLSEPKSRHFHPAEVRDSDEESKGPIPQKHVAGFPGTDVECPPAAPNCDHTGQDTNNRQKKHNTINRKQFHNYKLLSDTMIQTRGHQTTEFYVPGTTNPVLCFQQTRGHQTTEFYAWIFGAAMLAIISMVAMTSCFAYCLCSEKWRQRRAQRRKWDKNGEYERVDSVSSIVDNGTMTPAPDYNDNDIDAVSII